jgi:hypothetical protein
LKIMAALAADRDNFSRNIASKGRAGSRR